MHYLYQKDVGALNANMLLSLKQILHCYIYHTKPIKIQVFQCKVSMLTVSL
jgi:hypothetical protein